jgi:hypothetical protein
MVLSRKPPSLPYPPVGDDTDLWTFILTSGPIGEPMSAAARTKVEEKRENFSPRKLKKPEEREREKFCWKVTFSRENFSPEKTLK